MALSTQLVTCADKSGCLALTSGKSKYCREHKAEARARFREMLADQAEGRQADLDTFASIHTEAAEAGHKAATELDTTPMTVIDGATGERWHVGEGVCGFAEVTIRPGNSGYANFLKKNHGARKSYHGGVSLRIGDYGQSYERKMAYAAAYSAVAVKYGIKASPSGRLD